MHISWVRGTLQAWVLCMPAIAAVQQTSIPSTTHPPTSPQHLPGLYVVLMAAGSLLLGGAVRVVPFTLFGTYLAWAYLRFVQARNGVRWGC